MLFYPINEIDVSPVPGDGNYNRWLDADVSAHVPLGATGVIVHYVSTSNRWAHFGLRKKGSTDSFLPAAEQAFFHTWATIGVDASRIFQVWNYHLTFGYRPWKVYLVGYTMDLAVFNTNGVDKTPKADGTWKTIDCSAEAPGATALIFQGSGGTDSWSMIREIGSSFVWHASPRNRWIICGCNALQQIEGVIPAGQGTRFYLIGYITDKLTTLLDRVDKTPAIKDSWQDIDLSADVTKISNFALLQVADSDPLGVRKNTETLDIRASVATTQAIVAQDAAQVIEGWVELGGRIYLTGYAGGKVIFPSDSVARVSSIRHIFRPGMFRMELSLGDLGFDVDVAEATVRRALDVAKEPVEGAPPVVPPVVPPPTKEVPGIYPGHYIDVPIDRPVVDIMEMLTKRPDLMDVYREMGLLAGLDPEFEAMRKRGEEQFKVWRAAYDETPGTVADKTRAGIEAMHRAGLTRPIPTDLEAGMREMGLLPDVGGITIRQAQQELRGLQAHPLFREEFAGMTLKEYIAKYLTPGGE